MKDGWGGSRRKTSLMRVPENFDRSTRRLKSRLEEDGTKADLTDVVDAFAREVEASMDWWERRIRKTLEE